MRQKKLLLLLLSVSVLVACAAVYFLFFKATVSVLPETPASQAALTRCNSLSGLSISDYDLEVISVAYIDAVEKIPSSIRSTHIVKSEKFNPYCRFEGKYEQRIGADGKPYAIGFAVSFPDEWNGRFLFQGGGGLNGAVLEPLGAAASGDTPALFKGFAVVSTDSGHKGEIFDSRFFADQQALTNFFDQAIAKTTVLGKKLVSDYYNSEAKYSYFVGCSTGGREAMTMSQRYPDYFDGIIAGAPARTTNLSEVATLWSAYTLQGVAGDDSIPFSKDEQALIVNGVLNQCDAKDGLADNLIFDVKNCDFDPKVLQCSDLKTKKDGGVCLSTEKVSALKKAFSGPLDARGKRVYPGFYFDTGISATSDKGIPGLLQAELGPLMRTKEETFVVENELIKAYSSPLKPGNATLENLSSFSEKGGKLMFFHGISDPWFSAKDTENYFLKMQQANGGYKAVNNWSQLYFVPGMGHCHGGEYALDSFDMLSALVNWRENASVPKSVTSTGVSMPGISRPLCPYPEISTYDGKGSQNSESSFSCK